MSATGLVIGHVMRSQVDVMFSRSNGYQVLWVYTPTIFTDMMQVYPVINWADKQNVGGFMSILDGSAEANASSSVSATVRACPVPASRFGVYFDFA